MDADRFLRELAALFDDFPHSERPRDRRFARVLEAVEGLTRENNLALVNLAASCMGSGETYVEIGVYRGTSLIAAMLGNEEHRFVGIDDFHFREGSIGQVEENLRSFGLPSPILLVGDVFELVPSGALGEARVGAWYYDALHTHEAVLEGLRIAEPWLAPGALLIVDDSDWEQVGRALDDYLDAQPRAQRIFELGGKERGLPQWWEGVQVLLWEG
jgi:predicted O-methyltransferase YrrM